MDFGEITYVSNAGFLWTLDEKKVLVDGLCDCGSSVFQSLPESTYQQILQGQPPFDGLELLLISHHHSDHFSAPKTVKFLRQNQGVTVVSTNNVIKAIQAELAENEKYDLIPLAPPMYSGVEITVKGFNLSAYSLRHDGEQFAAVPNLAFLIRDKVKLMYVGDALASKENFHGLGLKELGLDRLVAPFPYVGLPSARKVITEYINPRKILAVHLPDEAKDYEGWIAATMKSYHRIKDNFYPTEFLSLRL